MSDDNLESGINWSYIKELMGEEQAAAMKAGFDACLKQAQEERAEPCRMEERPEQALYAISTLIRRAVKSSPFIVEEIVWYPHFVCLYGEGKMKPIKKNQIGLEIARFTGLFSSSDPVEADPEVYDLLKWSYFMAAYKPRLLRHFEISSADHRPNARILELLPPEEWK